VKTFVVRLVLVLALASCAAPATGCPDRYEGQTITVTGAVTTSASALGIVQLTTLKDARGNTCLVVSRAPLGEVGATITVKDQIAINNVNKTPSNYLYPASDPDLGK
jgi:hypothetical protein